MCLDLVLERWQSFLFQIFFFFNRVRSFVRFVVVLFGLHAFSIIIGVCF